jgi:mono/diheme cytochrome c family protein
MKAFAWLLWGLAGAAAAQGAPDGVALFAQHCATCHQADGSGTAGLAPALKGDHWRKLGATRAYVPAVLLHGLSGAISVNGANFIGSMPPVGAALGDAELAAITSHLRRLQGAEEAPYTADEFRVARAQTGSPPQTRQLRSQLLAK